MAATQAGALRDALGYLGISDIDPDMLLSRMKADGIRQPPGIAGCPVYRAGYRGGGSGQPSVIEFIVHDATLPALRDLVNRYRSEPVDPPAA